MKEIFSPNPNDKHIYENLYSGIGKGDTWTLPENFKENPRARAVLSARQKFNHSVNALDIGCGKGGNSKWIAESDINSNWVGVDIASHPGSIDSDNKKFLNGDFLNTEFRREHPEIAELKDIVIDQGAILVEIESLDKLDEYLELINSTLKEDGIFVALFMKGSHQVVMFPDGRKRVTWEVEDLNKEPFSKYFTIENIGQPFENGYSYLPEHPNSDFKNPLGAKVGDEMQVTMFQIMFRKKN